MPHPVMGTTRNYCRLIKALLTPYKGAITIEGVDLKPNSILNLEGLYSWWGIFLQPPIHPQTPLTPHA